MQNLQTGQGACSDKNSGVKLEGKLQMDMSQWLYGLNQRWDAITDRPK